jgi:hypothetical protein
MVNRCGEDKDRSRGDKFLELHEGVFLGQTPDEPNVLHGQVKECARMVREFRDEALVEIDETDERLYLLFVRRRWPVRYSGDLHWVHFHLVM